MVFHANHRHPLIVAVAAASALLSTDLHAEPTAQGAGLLEEVVVTASRTQQRVFDSPASLSLIGEEALARNTLPTLAEILRDVPGVQVTDSGQPGLARIRLRGEESRRTAILVNSQEVSDHHEVGTPLTLHPAMVERIEVVRGSGSVLYGSRALSGVVNFLTRKGGTQPVQASVSASYDGATSGYNAFASVYGNLGGTEYRLAYSESDHENRSTPAGDMENTAFDNHSTYVYLGRQFAEHHFDYTYEDYASATNVYVEEELKTTFPLTDFYLEVPRRDRRKHGLFYTWDADNSWLQSLQANAYSQISDRHFYSSTDTVWYARDVDTIGELDSRGALLQFNFQTWRDHTLIAGLQYIEDEVDQTRHVDTLSWTEYAVTGNEVLRDVASIETQALFAQDQWHFYKDFTLAAGVRQYFVDGDLSHSDRASLEPGKLDDDSELVAALGLVWEAHDDLRLRLNVAEGYVYPSLMQLATGAYAGSSYVNPNPDLEAETSVNYDFGLRLQRGGLIVDATAFYTESENYIHHQPCTADDNCPGRRDRRYLNIGKSRAHGLELYSAFSFADSGFESYASLTWMQRRNDYEALSTWKSGVPLLNGRAGLRWQSALSAVSGLWSDFYLRGESSSELEEPGTVRNVLEDKDSWVTVNLAGGLALGSEQAYRLTVELLNLTDRKYIPSTENLYSAERSIAARFDINW